MEGLRVEDSDGVLPLQMSNREGKGVVYLGFGVCLHESFTVLYILHTVGAAGEEGAFQCRRVIEFTVPAVRPPLKPVKHLQSWNKLLDAKRSVIDHIIP